MQTVGVFEAETQPAALLDEVEEGAESRVTGRGEAIARRVPASRPLLCLIEQPAR